jgi:hypothetical protein
VVQIDLKLLSDIRAATLPAISTKSFLYGYTFSGMRLFLFRKNSTVHEIAPTVGYIACQNWLFPYQMCLGYVGKPFCAATVMAAEWL